MSGLVKLLFPAGGENEEDVEELLKLAIECRKRVKDQLKRIDATYPTVEFSYTSKGGIKTTVQTLEEVQFPGYYHKSFKDDDDEDILDEGHFPSDPSQSDDDLLTKQDNTPVRSKNVSETEPQVGQIVVVENQKGISFDNLFGAYLKGATEIKITDPYLRVFHQIRNLMEFIETLVKFKAPEDDISLHIVTSPDETRMEQQVQYLEQVQQNSEGAGIKITWEFDGSKTIHARHITMNNGWKILLDRGLDVFQRFEMNDAFNLANRIQEQRACKSFEVTFVKSGD
jgi:ATP-dependent Lon protease